MSRFDPIHSHVDEGTGNIKTIAASEHAGKVKERAPFNPWAKGHWWQTSFKQDPTVVRITEEKVQYGPEIPEGW